MFVIYFIVLLRRFVNQIKIEFHFIFIQGIYDEKCVFARRVGEIKLLFYIRFM